MATHNNLGKQGEQEAVHFLKAKGYTIIAKNYRYDRAEIDLIAHYENTLVFIEVKTRSTVNFGYPEGFLTTAQQKRIVKAAQHYIEESNWQQEIRFDVISIVKNNDLTHIKDAFFLLDD